MAGSGIERASRGGRVLFWGGIGALAITLVVGGGSALVSQGAPPFGSQAYVEHVRQLKKAGRVEEALYELEREQRMNRHDVRASVMLARTLAQLGRPGSVDALRVAADQSFDPYLQIRLAASLARLARIEEADAALQRALVLAPRDAGVRLAVAQVYAESGRPEMARAAHREALALDPGSAAARRAVRAADEAAGRDPS